MENLIKCGAFDHVEKKPREQILKEYIESICDLKNKLTMQNANMLIDLHLLPADLDYESVSNDDSETVDENFENNPINK